MTRPEFEEPHIHIDQKIERLVSLLKSSKQVMVLTGAGISTSCGVPDFRSPQGIYTLEEQSDTKVQRTPMRYKPSFTHYALGLLMKQNVIRRIASLNSDGLHLLSGIPNTNLIEFHGNTNLEKCKACGTVFRRPFHVRQCSNPNEHHIQGRSCDNCGGELQDTIINDGEKIAEHDLELSRQWLLNSDLVLVLGSSLVSPPFEMLVGIAKSRNIPIVIINLQKTALDDICALRLFAKTDYCMQTLIQKLNLDKEYEEYVAANQGSEEPDKPSIETDDPNLQVFGPIGSTEEELHRMDVHDLKSILADRGIDYGDCIEKTDLIDKVLKTCKGTTFIKKLESH